MQFTAGSSRLQLPSLLLVAVVAGACSATGSGTLSPSPTTGPSSSSGTSSAAAAGGNVWTSAKVDPTKLPIGDASVSTSAAGVGKLFACSAGNANAGGADADGPWLDVAAGTWNSQTKLAVAGKVSWPSAKYSEAMQDGKRVLTTNDLPVGGQTGTFPIAADDPSYAYDKNPGTITATAISVTVASPGVAAAAPSCLPEGPVGVLKNGVLVFSSLDGRGHDAVAHESQDLCDGHPAMTKYHYHSVPSCIRKAATASSTVVGWAFDGFPITVERDAKGALPTNADLDECHGRTSAITVDGKHVRVYHYSATLEFPYFIGCFHGTATSLR